jgi:hypothetical protein
MSDKPSYLGLLNAVALGEAAAHCYLEAWIEVTDHDGVRATLQTVSAREGEHGMAFAKRINELGYTLKQKDDPGQAKRMKLAASDMTDLEKMEAFGLGRLDTGDKPDIFDGFFKDHTIDIQTGALLGRYIAEERDSGRLLRSCYEQLCAEAGRAPARSSSQTRDDDRLAALDAKIDLVCEAVGELRELVCAQAMPASSQKAKTNGSKARVTTS